MVTPEPTRSTPTLYSDLKFDPVKDFAPITGLVTFNNILNVPAASPAKMLPNWSRMPKTKPEGLSYGSQGVGTGGHLLGVLFAKQAGINLIHVPYRGIAPAVTDTVAGRMDMLFAGYLSSGSHVEAGRLRLLAIAGSKRHPRLPDLPTMAEAGYPDVQMDQWFGLFAPAKTPAPIVQKLNAEFVKALQSVEVRDKVLPQVFSVMADHARRAWRDCCARHRAARSGCERSRALRRQTSAVTPCCSNTRWLVGMLRPNMTHEAALGGCRIASRRFSLKNIQDGGEAILEALRSLNVEYVISSPGSEWPSVWEALARQKKHGTPGPTYLDCGHETLAVAMATGFTQVTGRMQAVLLHAGAGLLQGSMAIYGARTMAAPMLVMSGESLELWRG